MQSSCRVLCYILFSRSRQQLLSHRPLGSFNATHCYYLHTVVKAGTTAVTTYAVAVNMIFLALIVKYQEPGTKHLENDTLEMEQEVNSLGTQALVMPLLVVDKVALQVVLKVV